ncbi:hypothetical protein OHB41_34045 [Streptomyces sp. NBC_01571]|uniref:hypothetical protein n=1 Tax=Streptomyces sp. NBC_01571 TaxID=2975883 RepID=UPI00224D4DE5|nr:hypothetical protein [Streptomyces sp. NBC_01571]MCX4578125.1 hypothetical protein [Streptomyces sp. NBC_01571]
MHQASGAQPERSAAPPPPPPAEPSHDDIARWLKDPANREAVSYVLRREARIDPRWLSDLVRSEERMRGGRMPGVS